MNHLAKHRGAAGRRLAIERCEPRELLSISSASLEDARPAAWSISPLAYETENVAGFAADSFVPTPAGAGTVRIDADSNLVQLDAATPLASTNGLVFGRSYADVTPTPPHVISSGLTDRDEVFLSFTWADLDWSPFTIVIGDTEVELSRPIFPVADDLDTDAADEVTPGHLLSGSVDELLVTGASSAPVSRAGFPSEPAVPSSPILTLGPGEPRDESRFTDAANGSLNVPSIGKVTPPANENGSVTLGSDALGAMPTADSPSTEGAATEATTPRDEVRDDTNREAAAVPMVVIDDRAVERLVSRPAPPADSGAIGAGAIDLTGLLFAEETAVAPVDAAPIAGSDGASDVAARDAALALESWVRAIPAPAMATPNAGVAARAEVVPPAFGSMVPGRRAAGSVTISIDGDRLSSADAASADPAAEATELPSLGASAAVRIERGNAYRYAVTALSALLGGAVIGVVQRRGSDAGSGREQGEAGRARPRKACREIGPNCG